ncbi:GntR family transcriptional regulator [Corynebacterium sp.]|uniref:GntR family transcriptional regulator n=1 Tax=Corynebacterium sp. TaxID=1720 RepID=UPI0028AC9798|nr:GntR family transcriptional regulator [Corynebacterium sp.]
MAPGDEWAKRIEQVGRESALSQSTLKQSTQNLIRQLLFSGIMVPGEIYSANSLASHLGISNSPAREAMMALAAIGLLEPVRNRGFRVVELSEHDRYEVYEMRVLIEVEAARQAATRDIGIEAIENVVRLAQRSIEALPPTREDPALPYLNADHDFHMAVVDSIGNSRWSKTISNLRDESRVNGAYRHLEDNQGLQHSALEHIDIANAVQERDPEKAAALMLKHLEYARPKNYPPAS